jgi:hypothetical protein
MDMEEEEMQREEEKEQKKLSILKRGCSVVLKSYENYGLEGRTIRKTTP